MTRDEEARSLLRVELEKRFDHVGEHLLLGLDLPTVKEAALAAISEALRQRDELAAVVRECREALRPFADGAECLDDDESVSSLWEHAAVMDLNSGHLRTARNLFDKIGGGE